MINTQRYKDSVKTFQSFLQQQYNLVYNVQNGREQDGLSCSVGGAGPVISEGGVTAPRGQSGCIMLGRIIHITEGSKVSVYAIIGEDNPNDTSVTDIQAILARNPSRVEQDLGLSESELTIPWEAEVVDADGNRADMAIAIIRSPLKGSVHTFSQRLTNPNLPPIDDDLVNAANESQDANLCLDPGTIFAGEQTGVVLKARASAQSFVQTITDGASVC